RRHHEPRLRLQPGSEYRHPGREDQDHHRRDRPQRAPRQVREQPAVKRLVATAAVFLAAGCGGDLSPRIQMFAAYPSSVALGQPTELVFSVDLATSLSIDQGVGNVTGKKSVTVTPTGTTTYTLTATRSAWGTLLRSTATATVTTRPHGPASRI